MRAGLDHVHLFASDVARTTEWFRTLFGASVVRDEEAAGVRNVRLALGRAFVHRYDQPPKAPRGGAVRPIGIETDDPDALVAHMESNGARFRKPVRDEPAFRYAMVAGPDDLLIGLYECREPVRRGIER